MVNGSVGDPDIGPGTADQEAAVDVLLRVMESE
jgi:hypothetical protein